MGTSLTEEILARDPGRILANQRLFAEILGHSARERRRLRHAGGAREFPEGGRHGEGRPLVGEASWVLPPSHPLTPPPRPPEKISPFDPLEPLAGQKRNEERLEGISRARLFNKEDVLAWVRKNFDVISEWRRIPGTDIEQITLRDRSTGKVLLQLPLDELIPKILEGLRLRGAIFSRLT